MDEATLENRTGYIFYRLSCEDPKYPKVNFFVRLMDDTKRSLSGVSNQRDISENAIQEIMTATVRQFVGKHESSWKEIAGEWFSGDIYEAVKTYVRRAD